METGQSKATTGIRRAGPPQAVQKLREDFYLIQLPLSEMPGADWKRLFYDIQRGFPPEFPPRSVEMSGAMLRFRSDAASVEQKVALIDQWVARANEKGASMGARSEEERRRREELAREHQELAELNARWEKL
jgi:hypothetical protein